MNDEEKASDIYDICLEKKSICCYRKMGEETCNKCKTFQMYRLGLAEGKPQWHNLRENPDDLPKNREEVLLYVKIHDKQEREVILIGYRDYGFCLGEYCKDWGYVDPVHGSKYDFVCDEEVIAWAKLPKFEEK